MLISEFIGTDLHIFVEVVLALDVVVFNNPFGISPLSPLRSTSMQMARIVQLSREQVCP
jgi:hypothetical protein